GGLHDEGIRKAVHVDAVLGAHAFGPVLRELHAVAAGHVVAGPPRVLGAHFESGGVDDAVDLVLHAGYDDTGLGDALDALAVGVDQTRARLVVGLEVLV